MINIPNEHSNNTFYDDNGKQGQNIGRNYSSTYSTPQSSAPEPETLYSPVNNHDASTSQHPMSTKDVIANLAQSIRDASLSRDRSRKSLGFGLEESQYNHKDDEVEERIAL